MSNSQERYIKVFLSEEACDTLCEKAAEYDMDVNIFISKICRDIAELGMNWDASDRPLRHLDKYLETRHHETDYGFLVSLFVEEAFAPALKELNRIRCSDDNEKAYEEVYKHFYDEYLKAAEEDAEDSYEVAREKLEKAWLGRLSLTSEKYIRAKKHEDSSTER